MTIPATNLPLIFHGSKMFFEPEWEEVLAKIGLMQGKDWDTLEPGTLISGSRRVNTYRVNLEQGKIVYFKRYVYDRHNIRFFLRPSKATIEVFAYEQFHKMNIDTLRPIAFGEKRLWGTMYTAFIVTESLEDSVSLDNFAIETWSKMNSKEKNICFKDISHVLIPQMHKVHAKCFFHHDLKWRNILIKEIDHQYKLYWMDSPRASYRPVTKKHGILIELSSLARLAISYLSRTQRLRFLTQYYKGNIKEAKKMFHKIIAHHKKRPPKKLN